MTCAASESEQLYLILSCVLSQADVEGRARKEP